MSQHLEKRITAVLVPDATSADVATMIAEVNAALPTAVDAAERERIKAYDPTVDAQKARSRWPTLSSPATVCRLHWSGCNGGCRN